MTARKVPTRYVIVSPVKDEERYVESTLKSVAGQSARPDRWVIVDDGSNDTTGAILARFATQHDWVRVLTRPSGGARRPGSPVMNAFYAGLDQVELSEYDYVVKLDCDVELPENYFAELLNRFADDPRLGIASGVYLEEEAGEWQVIPMPKYHAAGASKVIRAQCFAEIGGFVRERGWDTVDEIRAQVRGWHTRHFDEVRFRHLKPEGSGVGNWHTGLMHGEVLYLTGGGVGFLLLKVVHRMFTGAPFIFGGVALLFGYVRMRLAGREKLVDSREEGHYRMLLNSRICGHGLARAMRRRPTRSQAL